MVVCYIATFFTVNVSYFVSDLVSALVWLFMDQILYGYVLRSIREKKDDGILRDVEAVQSQAAEQQQQQQQQQQPRIFDQLTPNVRRDEISRLG